jgi:hypothetical protein
LQHINHVNMSTRREQEKKKEHARILYLQGEAQKSIAEKVGASAVKLGGWESVKAAQNITRPELVNKLLVTVNKLLDEVNDSNDPAALAGLSDKLSKLASVIEKLDKKANIVDAIEVFMSFGKWIQYRSSFDANMTPELVKAINKFQDLYISEHLTK